MRAALCTGGHTCLTDASRTHLALKKEKVTLLMALPDVNSMSLTSMASSARRPAARRRHVWRRKLKCLTTPSREVDERGARVWCSAGGARCCLRYC